MSLDVSTPHRMTSGASAIGARCCITAHIAHSGPRTSRESMQLRPSSQQNFGHLRDRLLAVREASDRLGYVSLLKTNSSAWLQAFS
jgi:hypothetical protein